MCVALLKTLNHLAYIAVNFSEYAFCIPWSSTVPVRHTIKHYTFKASGFQSLMISEPTFASCESNYTKINFIFKI